MWEEAREALENSRGIMKADYDQHRHDNTKYDIGEIVVMTTVTQANQPNCKINTVDR